MRCLWPCTEPRSAVRVFSIDGLVREREASLPCESERQGWVAARQYLGTGLTRWIFAGLGRRSRRRARAGEEREAASATVKSRDGQAERASSTDSLRPATPTGSRRRTSASPSVRAKQPAKLADRGHGARPAPETPIERAIRTIAESQARYERVEDYTCTFYKRERIAGRLTPLHIMSMKVRTKPQSIYFKFQQPAQGREAIYIAGRHGSKVLAHDVGLNKFLAGTLAARAHLARGHGRLPASDHRGRNRSPARHPGETLGRRTESRGNRARLPRRHARRARVAAR